MRHRVITKTLNRDTEHRKALEKNLAESLIKYEKIVTTEVKAKFFKPYIERLITKAKNVDKNDKVDVFNTVKYLRTKLVTEEIIRKLMEDIAPRFAKRNGGYTRIVKVGNRGGDKAMLARIELVETKNKSDKEKLAKKQIKAKKVKVEEKTDEQ